MIETVEKDIWSEIERQAWKLPRQMSVSEWADEYRILDPMTSAEPGQWRTDRTPYLRGIMDAFTDPHVEEITIMASTQVGKTESMYNMIGYAIDQDPGPALLVMPRQDDAKSVSGNRIRPMLKSSTALARHINKRFDDIKQLEYRLDHMVLYFAGSNSPADLAQRPIRYLFLDEIDKYSPFSGKEADPIKLATERTRTYWNRKIVKCSTPTTRHGYIFREFEKSEKNRYYVPCPYCGYYQVLIFSQIRGPEDERDTKKIKSERLAWYECESCQGKITDYHKPKMLQNGVWCPDGCSVELDGSISGERQYSSHRGFWISAAYSPWLTFSEILAEFFGTEGFPELLMNFINSWLAEIWEEKTEKSKPEQLKTKALTYREGEVPVGVLVLTAGVDAQKGHFYLVIRGWGLGEESWLIRAARVESWEDVIFALFNTTYPSATRGVEPFSVRLTCIDSGYRTNEVYEVCRRFSDIARPTKGQSFTTGIPYKVSVLDRHPGTGQTIQAGLKLWHLDTAHFKDKIHRMVHADPGDPAQWHLFADPSEDYLKQFCAEQKIVVRDKKGRSREEWRPISAGAPNHYLDAEVGAVAAADMIRVAAMRKDDQAKVYQPQVNKKSASWVKRGGWNSQNKKSWVNR